MRALALLVAILPVRIATRLLSALLSLSVHCIPSLMRTLRRNLEIAYPDLDSAQRRQLISASFESLARVFVDFVRLPRLSKEWFLEHVQCPFFPRFLELRGKHPGKGILIATGHLGSFELLAQFVAVKGNPISFVVRDFKLPRLDRWWRAARELYGNRVISRKGAFKELSRELQAGHDVAMLIDQNITRNHAVFVEWFGTKAATAKSFAIAALRSEAQVVVAAIRYLGDDKYQIDAEECDFRALYQDQALSIEAKVFAITQKISERYESFIRRSPAEWFWLHRRWKTRPENEAENMY